jgi:integrase/recombinase XerD
MATVDMSGAAGDVELVALWLEGKASMHTRRVYGRVAARFLDATRKPLRHVTLADVQSFVSSLTGATSSKATSVHALKSLLTFAQRTGYTAVNVGAAVQAPRAKDTLAQRILPEDKIHAMLALEPVERNRLLLRLLYCSGARVSEICALRWRDVQPNGEVGQVTLYGKGGKTRAVLLSAATWAELAPLRGGDDVPVFLSRKGGALDVSSVRRIVNAAADRVGLHAAPHWLRHAHASHALDRGAPVHLVQATLGHASVSTTGRYLHAKPSDSSSRYLGV